VIEEMLQTLHGTAAIDVSLAMKDEGLRIVVNGDHGAPANGEVEPLEARLTTARARLELIGGALRIGSDADDDWLLAEIPLRR
jgi:hypothetical protein